jgi:hypothetical protein
MTATKGGEGGSNGGEVGSDGGETRFDGDQMGVGWVVQSIDLNLLE